MAPGSAELFDNVRRQQLQRILFDGPVLRLFVQQTAGMRMPMIGKALAILIGLQTPLCADEDYRGRIVFVDGDIMTNSVTLMNRADACSSAIFQAKNFCAIRRFNNITSVKCECQQNDQGNFECVAAVACQD